MSVNNCAGLVLFDISQSKVYCVAVCPFTTLNRIEQMNRVLLIGKEHNLHLASKNSSNLPRRTAAI